MKLTQVLLEGLASEIAAVMREYTAVQLAPLQKRIAELEAATESLGSRVKNAEEKGLEYKGVWSEDEAYSQGDAVTSGGSMWIALRPSSGRRPGLSDDGRGRAWQLAVSRGRDGKDART